MKIARSVFSASTIAGMLLSSSVAYGQARALILQPTVYGSPSQEQQAAQSELGLTVDVVSPTQWDSMSAADFAKYQLLILGDPACTGAPGTYSAAASNANVWGPVVNGNVFIFGTDPVFHSTYGGVAGAYQLTKSGINFAGSIAGKTGLYASLSCAWGGGGSVPMLDYLSTHGTFTAANVDCTNTAHIVATSPALAGLTDAALSNWYCSVHEGFSAWPVDFTVLAIDEASTAFYTASDGTKGSPYILARGVSLTVISNIQITPGSSSVPAGGSATLSATVVSGGSPVAGTAVTFKVISGPDTGQTATVNTNSSGTATFTVINGTPTKGQTDYVSATFVDSSSHTETSNTATILWTDTSVPVFSTATSCGAHVLVNAGSTVTYPVSVSDPDSDPVTLSVSGLPGGAFMSPALPYTGNPGASTFSWTPTSAQGGAYTVNFTGTDPENLTASCFVVVNVQVDTPPTITPNISGTMGNNGWYRSAVNVTWTVADAHGTITSTTGCDPTTLSSDTAGVSLTCSATNDAGQTTTQSVSIKIDQTPPSISAAASPAPNGNGWNNSPVTVTFTGSDSMSGLASCAPAVTLSGDGANQSATGTCTDNAGNTASTTLGGINIDRTPPTITYVSRTAPNSAGWNNTNVAVNWSCSDAVSGVASASVSQTVSSEGANQSATGTCTDLAGNTASNTQSGINIDKTPPTLTFAAQSPGANTAGWNNTNVAFAYTTSDNLSGVVSSLPASPLVLTAEGASVTGTVTVTDKAGNTATFTSPAVKIDKTAPVATATASPAPDSYGWNNTNVTVTFTGTDSLSGIASCSPAVTLTADGANQSATGTCTDVAGNVSAPATKSGINIDKTPPSITGLPAAGSCVLWPPNNKLVQVAVVSPKAALAPIVPSSFVVSATSNEPQDSPQGPDIVITGPMGGPATVQLRATRDGNGTGRIYTITATETDQAGNKTTSTTTCTVPHDQSSQ